MRLELRGVLRGNHVVVSAEVQSSLAVTGEGYHAIADDAGIGETEFDKMILNISRGLAVAIARRVFRWNSHKLSRPLDHRLAMAYDGLQES